MPTRSAPSSILVWAALITLYVVWGSTYLGIAVAVETIPPFLMVGVRFVIAGVLLVGLVALFQREGLRRPTLLEIRDSAIVGTLLVAGGNGLVTLGQQTIPSGIAALLVALMPVWMAVLGRVAFGDRLPRLVTAGVAIGFGGVAILAWPDEVSGPLEPVGLAVLLLAPMAWAIGSLFAVRKASLPRPTLMASALQMLAGGVVMSIAALLSGEAQGFDISAVSTESIIGFVFLTLIGSIVGYSAYAWLLGAAPISLVSTYAYVNPVVAVILGALVLNEAITPRHIVAGAVIVVAVAIIITARSRMSAPKAPESALREEARPEPALRPVPRISPRPEPTAD